MGRFRGEEGVGRLGCHTRTDGRADELLTGEESPGRRLGCGSMIVRSFLAPLASPPHMPRVGLPGVTNKDEDRRDLPVSGTRAGRQIDRQTDRQTRAWSHLSCQCVFTPFSLGAWRHLRSFGKSIFLFSSPAIHPVLCWSRRIDRSVLVKWMSTDEPYASPACLPKVHACSLEDTVSLLCSSWPSLGEPGNNGCVWGTATTPGLAQPRDKTSQKHTKDTGVIRSWRLGSAAVRAWPNYLYLPPSPTIPTLPEKVLQRVLQSHAIE